MSAPSLSSEDHQAVRDAIAAHFAGRLSPERESAMRAHTLGCDGCRDRYHRHLVLAQLDPGALPREVRMGRGLGLSMDGGRPRRSLAFRLALVLLPAAAALLLFARPHGPGSTLPGGPGAIGDGTFASRGTDPGARGPALWIYRVGADGRPRVAEGVVGADEEWAFAYANPGGQRFLMVFAVDRHRHVRWFHPAWGGGQRAPSAIPALPGPGPHELPEAIRHPFDDETVRVYALFARRPLTTDEVEERVRAAPAWDAATFGDKLGDDLTVVSRPVQVTR